MATITNSTPKKTRGGFRVGAGRKRTGQMTCIVLSMEEINKVKEIGDGSLADGIKKAIRLFKVA
jgi:hypothetical protein